MKVEHIKLDDMYRAYASSILNIDGNDAILIASEEKGYPCMMYSGERFSEKSVVWEDGGGCMSIIQIPDRDNEILAIRDFYLKESPSNAKLVWGKYESGNWRFHDILHLPYLHRFDIYAIEEEIYVVLATIADDKDFKDDWTRSGSIYYAKLSEDNKKLLEPILIKDGLYRNHGYYRLEENDEVFGYFTSDEGIYKLNPKDGWKFTKILDGKIGEVAVMDINGDGIKELITIEPFHGDTIKIYEITDNMYQEVYRIPFELDFGHALVADSILGVPTFVGGIRRVGNQLFMIQYLNLEYILTVIDDGGPSNLSIGHGRDYDYISSSNHTRNEAAVYLIKK